MCVSESEREIAWVGVLGCVGWVYGGEREIEIVCGVVREIQREGEKESERESLERK